MQAFLLLLSFLIVAFGQPAWNSFIGLFAAVVGFALFWRVLLDYPDRRHRFYIAAGWFTAVQFVQLSWLLSHPFYYIYPLYLFFSVALGLQFGILGLFINRRAVTRFFSILAITSLWTLFEWSRLFFLSGYSWNPVGLSLTGELYPLQMAGLWGVFGLSFWVIFVNLLSLRTWVLGFRVSSLSLGILAALFPYFYGMMQLSTHQDAIQQHSRPPLHAVLVQTTFPAEATLNLKDKKATISHALKEWKQILRVMKKQQALPIDLIVLPEYAVRCGTYSFVFPYQVVVTLFKELLASQDTAFLPPLEMPWAHSVITPEGPQYLVNNAFIAQGIANYFNSGIVLGLEDAEDIAGKREFYSVAVYLQPNSSQPIGRYEKRVLIPLGEYIPFEFCKKIAESYGVYGSFTCGKEAKIFHANHIPFGLSICYEETFGNLMRDNKHRGAELLVNLTNDAWYPNSRLPQQHFSHARLRSVENGIPVIRASNAGITGAIDSLGRIVQLLGEDHLQPDSIFDSIRISVPTHTYHTPYSYFGDTLIIGSSLAILMLFLVKRARFD